VRAFDRNALWTEVPIPAGFATDIGAGNVSFSHVELGPLWRKLVEPQIHSAEELVVFGPVTTEPGPRPWAGAWITTTAGRVAVFDMRTGRFALMLGQWTSTPKRISVGPDGTVLCARADGVVSVWDTSASRFTVPTTRLPPGAASDISLGASGYVVQVSMDSPSKLRWLSHRPGHLGQDTWVDLLPGMQKAVINVTKVAVDESLTTHVWACHTDGRLVRYSLDAPETPRELTPPGGAKDVGAGPGQSVYAVGGYPVRLTSGLLAPGSQLWRLEGGVRWNLVEPGWATAVDVDGDGRPWVVDATGRVHVRGGEHN
jgi:hypothetical protein